MDIRVANEDDIGGVIVLQGKNLVSCLAEDERGDGFVTTPFTEAQLVAILGLDGLFVAIDDGGIVRGYVMAAGWDYFSQWAMFPFMIEKLSGVAFGGLVVDDKNSFQYGPVCVDAVVRGQGVFEGMFELMRAEMKRRYPIGLTFINTVNGRSYVAHTKKVGLRVVDEFGYGDQRYYCLGFETGE